MNDNTKVLDQNPGTPQAPIQPVPGVGGANKEAVRPVVAPVSEFLRPSGVEAKHNISQESAKLGVEEVQDRPDLTQVADMQHAGPSVPPPLGPTGSISIPTREEALADLKTKNPTDSGWGFDKLVIKALDALGLKGF